MIPLQPELSAITASSTVRIPFKITGNLLKLLDDGKEIRTLRTRLLLGHSLDQPFHVVPSQRGIELFCDVLLNARAPLALHGELLGLEIGQLEMVGQLKFVAHVGATDAEHRSVDGQHEGLEAGSLGASHEAAGQLAVLVDVELEPLFSARRRGGHFFDRARRQRAHCVDCVDALGS